MASKKGSIIGVVAILFGVAGIAYLTVGSRLQKLGIGFNSFSNKLKFSFPYLYVPINIVITNPTSRPVTFQSLVADVYFNGTKSSQLTYNTAVTLAANKDTTISGIVIKTEVFSAVNQSLDAVLSKSISVNIKGTMKADSMSFPFDENLNLQ